MKSKGQKAKQVSRWGTAACRKYDVTWGRRWFLSLQPLTYSLHKQGKQQTRCPGTTLELRDPIRPGQVKEQPQTQGPFSVFSSTSRRGPMHNFIVGLTPLCQSAELFSSTTRESIACGYTEQVKQRANIHPLILLIRKQSRAFPAHHVCKLFVVPNTFPASVGTEMKLPWVHTSAKGGSKPGTQSHCLQGGCCRLASTMLGPSSTWLGWEGTALHPTNPLPMHPNPPQLQQAICPITQ